MDWEEKFAFEELLLQNYYREEEFFQIEKIKLN